MQELTRDQAIKRIKDIRKEKAVSHIRASTATIENLGHNMKQCADLMHMNGAINELKAIFDITEEELK